MNGQFKNKPFLKNTETSQEVNPAQIPSSESEKTAALPDGPTRAEPGPSLSPDTKAAFSQRFLDQPTTKSTAQESHSGYSPPLADVRRGQAPPVYAQPGSMATPFSPPAKPGPPSVPGIRLPSTLKAPSQSGNIPTSLPGVLPAPLQVPFSPGPLMERPGPLLTPRIPTAPSIADAPTMSVPSLPGSMSSAPRAPSLPGSMSSAMPGYPPSRPGFNVTPDMSQMEQLTEQTANVPIVMPTFLLKTVSLLPGPLRFAATEVLTKIADHAPETVNATLGRIKAVKSQAANWGWLPVATFVSALGLLIVNIAYNISRFSGVETLHTYTTIEILFFAGLLLIFTPTSVRLLSPFASRFERIGLLCMVGIMLYLVQLTNSPLHFANFNEFLHWNTADSIVSTGHLYRDDNTLLPVSPYYPGLEIVTNALSSLSGLHTFHAGLLVLGASRVLLILSLFFLYERVTKSARMAGIATIIYMTNPHFISFDVQFSYESMALPLAAFMLYVLSFLDSFPYKQRVITLVVWLTLAAIALTHHMTDYVFDGFLLLLVFTYGFQRPARHHYVVIALTLLLSIFLSVAVAFLIPNNPAIAYLSSYFGGAFAQLMQVITGTSHARSLFQGYSGLPSPLWDHLLAAASVVIVGLSFPFGLLYIWLRQRFKSLPLMFGIAALGYPLTQAFRFTSFGSEITDRSASFLFIPIAYVLTLLIVQFWPLRRLKSLQVTYITIAISVIFISGVMLQAGPGLSFLPGPYLVSADNRSIEPEGIQDAVWAAKYLGSGNRVATDRINRLLMSTYGKQYVVTNLDNKVDTAQVFFASTLGPNELALLKMTSVHYLVVDLRLSTRQPLEGVYFEDGEPGSYAHNNPIPIASLNKFNAIPGINRLFDSGNIVIYDVGGLSHAS